MAGQYWDASTQSWVTPEYQQGATISSPDNMGGSITQAANPYQFATEGTAQNLAKMLGGSSYGQNIDMPGGSFSTPQQMIDVNGRQINAGLAAQTYGQYGSAPGSYGNYLVSRDIAGKPIADPWANGSDAQRGGVGNWQGVSFDTDPATQARMADLTRRMYNQPPNPYRPPVTSAPQAPNTFGSYQNAASATASSPAFQSPYPAPGTTVPPRTTSTNPPPSTYGLPAPTAGTPLAGAPRPTQGSYTTTANPTRLGTTAPQSGPAPSFSHYDQNGVPIDSQGNMMGGPANTFANSPYHSLFPGAPPPTYSAPTSATSPQAPAGAARPDYTTTANPTRLGTRPNAITPNTSSVTTDADLPPSGVGEPPLTTGGPDEPGPPPVTGVGTADAGPGQWSGGAPSGAPTGPSTGGYPSGPGYPPSGSAPSMLQQYNSNLGNGTPPDGGFNPAQQYRYGFQQQYNPQTGQLGPTPPTGSAPDLGTGAYGEHGYANGSSFYPTDGNDIDIAAANDRNWALGTGGAIQNNLQNYTNYQQGRASNYEDLSNSAYAPIANGYGGYSDAEKSAILNNGYLQNLQLGADQAQSNYLTPEEQAGMAGNPWAPIDQLSADEQGMDRERTQQNQFIYDAMGGQDSQVRNALDDTGNRLRGAVGDQAQDERATLGGYANNVRGALDYGEDYTRSYLDRDRLGLSDRYQQNYDVNEADMQGIRNKAGRTVQSQEQMDEDNLNRAANAQGNTSPMALATMRDRMRQTGAVNSANAMSNAQIAAKQLSLTTEQNRENTRLGAEQNYANLGSGTELALGGRRVGAENTLGQAALGVANDIGTAARGAEQYLGNQRQQAEQYLGGSRLSNQQQVANRNQSADIFKTGTNLGAFQTADQQAAARAGVIAGNRQATNLSNQNTQYDRGKYIYNAGSQANTGFANARMGDEQAYRNYLSGQQNQANQNVTIGNQQQTGNLGTTSGAITGAEGNRIVNYKTPSTAEKALTTVANIVSGAEGGVSHGPHMALVGEAGPELIINLHKIKHDEYGESPDESGSPSNYGGYDSTDDDYAALQQSGAEGGYDTGKPDHRNYHNPLYRAIQAKLGQYGYTPPPEDNPIAFGGSGGGGHKGSLIGGMAKKGIGSLFKMAFLGDGGVVAPGVEYVDEPELRMLGGQGAEAVVPLTPRPGNKVRMEDIPALAAKYGDYGGSCGA